MDAISNLLAKSSVKGIATTSHNFTLGVEHNKFLPAHTSSVRINAFKKGTKVKVENVSFAWCRQFEARKFPIDNRTDTYHFGIEDLGKIVVCIVESEGLKEVACFGPVVLYDETRAELDRLLSREKNAFSAQTRDPTTKPEIFALEPFTKQKEKSLEITIDPRTITFKQNDSEEKVSMGDIFIESSPKNPMAATIRVRNNLLSFLTEASAPSKDVREFMVKFSSRLTRDNLMILSKLFNIINVLPYTRALCEIEEGKEPVNTEINLKDLKMISDSLRRSIASNAGLLKKFFDQNQELKSYAARLEDDLKGFVNEMKSATDSQKGAKQSEVRSTKTVSSELTEELRKEKEKSEGIAQSIKNLKDRINAKREQGKRVAEGLDSIKNLNKSLALSAANPTDSKSSVYSESERLLETSDKKPSLVEKLVGFQRDCEALSLELHAAKEEGKRAQEEITLLSLENKTLVDGLKSSDALQEKEALIQTSQRLTEEKRRMTLKNIATAGKIAALKASIAQLSIEKVKLSERVQANASLVNPPSNVSEESQVSSRKESSVKAEAQTAKPPVVENIALDEPKLSEIVETSGKISVDEPKLPEEVEETKLPENNEHGKISTDEPKLREFIEGPKTTEQAEVHKLVEVIEEPKIVEVIEEAILSEVAEEPKVPEVAEAPKVVEVTEEQEVLEQSEVPRLPEPGETSEKAATDEQKEKLDQPVRDQEFASKTTESPEFKETSEEQEGPSSSHFTPESNEGEAAESENPKTPKAEELTQQVEAQDPKSVEPHSIEQLEVQTESNSGSAPTEVANQSAEKIETQKVEEHPSPPNNTEIVAEQPRSNEEFKADSSNNRSSDENVGFEMIAEREIKEMKCGNDLGNPSVEEITQTTTLIKEADESTKDLSASASKDQQSTNLAIDGSQS